MDEAEHVKGALEAKGSRRAGAGKVNVDGASATKVGLVLHLRRRRAPAHRRARAEGAGRAPRAVVDRRVRRKVGLPEGFEKVGVRRSV